MNFWSNETKQKSSRKLLSWPFLVELYGIIDQDHIDEHMYTYLYKYGCTIERKK